MDQITLINEFRTDLKLQGLSADTLEKYPMYVRALYNFNNKDLIGVDEKVLSAYLEYLRSKKLKYVSISKYFTGINSFFKYLVWKKYITVNPVLPVRDHYLRQYKSHDTKHRRQCLTIEQAARLVNSIYNTRDKAIIIFMLKTGVRIKELAELDAKDIDVASKTIRLKPTAKRSNEVIYFDDETAFVLGKWMKRRELINKKGSPALFLDQYGGRLKKESVYKLFIRYAIAAGLHNPTSSRLQERLSPHCTRHFFTNRLIEAGCPREYVKELRGDAGKDAIDIYIHIDRNKLRRAYEDCIPQFGILG